MITLFYWILLLTTLLSAGICPVCYSQECGGPSQKQIYCSAFPNMTQCAPCDTNCDQCSLPGYTCDFQVCSPPIEENNECLMCQGVTVSCNDSSTNMELLYCNDTLGSDPSVCIPCPTFCTFCYPPFAPTSYGVCQCPPTLAPTPRPTRRVVPTPAPTPAPTAAPLRVVMAVRKWGNPVAIVTAVVVSVTLFIFAVVALFTFRPKERIVSQYQKPPPVHQQQQPQFYNPYPY